MTVLRGRGDGTFGDATGYGVGWTAKQITVADVDANGSPDLVVSNLFTNSISILLSDSRVPVLLSGLTAAGHDGVVSLAWDLAPGPWTDVSAIDVARGATESGPFERITPAPLAPQAHMTFQDRSPVAGLSWYRVEAVFRDGAIAVAGPVQVVTRPFPRAGIVSIVTTPEHVRVRYVVATRDPVALGIYDVRGRLVRTLFAGVRVAGAYDADWSLAEPVARGVYLVRLQARDVHAVRKFVLASE